METRVLKLDEKWEKGDVIHYPDGDTTIVDTIAGTYVERPLPERPAKPSKWRDLEDGEYISEGDRYMLPQETKWRYRTNWQSGYTVAEWRNVSPLGGRAQRRVEPKRKRLEKLVKRMENMKGWQCAKTQIVIFSDGSGHIENASGGGRFYEFESIRELCDYLAGLPKREAE